MLELRHLRYFVVVAEELHVTRAARRLGIAQPALSQQMKRLEQLLDFPLFDRTGPRIELTEAGEVFFREALKTLYQAERAVHHAAITHQGKRGRLSIGFLASFGRLATLVSRYKARYPDVELNLNEMTSAEQQAALRDGRIDIGFSRDLEPDDELHVEPLYREPLRLAVHETHRLSRQLAVKLEALSSEKFVIFPKPLGPSLYRQITLLCEQAGFTPRIVQEAVQMQTIISLVAGGIGLAFVPLSSCQQPVAGVRFLELIPEPSVNLNLVQRQANSSAAQQAFVALARRIVGRGLE